MPWTVAITKPNQYALAIRNLERQNFLPFHPVFAVKRLYRDKPRTCFEPMFSGYIFILLQDSQLESGWSPISNTFGIVRVLTKPSPTRDGFSTPAIIPDDFIRSLKQVTTREDGAYLLQPGTRVRILRGPMIAHEAVFTAMTGSDRCAIITDLLQRRIRVEISTFDIEVVEQP
jgi:transcriptional antiterminator RfaH